MQFTDLSFTAPALPESSNSHSAASNKMWRVLLFSAIIHAVIFTLVALQHEQHTIPKSEPTPISAVLVFAKNTPPIASHERIDEPAVSAELKDTFEQDVEVVIDASARPITDEVLQTPELTEQHELPKPALSDAQEAPEQEVLSLAEDSPAQRFSSIAKSIRNGVLSQQHALQNRLAEEAANAFRQQRVSPDLKSGEYPVIEQEPIGEYEINCDTGVNSSLRVVAGLFGGNVKCSRRNDFQRYVDKRIKKTDHNPINPRG